MTLKYRARMPVVVSVLVTVLLVAFPSSADHRQLRSGTIVSGVFTTSPSWNCEDVPDCRAWLISHCDPALAGRDPAWLASIVDVADLADGATVRSFGYGPASLAGVSPAGVAPGGVTIEFWTKDCRRAGGSTRIWLPGADFNFRYDELSIPSRVKWMTVTGNDKLNAAWTLN